MRILVTGITGFVGSTAANYFSSLGHDVVGIGRQAALPAHVNPHCSYIKSDLRNPLPMIEADVVIHAAALASDTANYTNLYATNVRGTEHVLQATAGATAFIYISSSSVYHFEKPMVAEEEAGLAFASLSAYGQTKYLAEGVVAKNTTIAHKYILRPRAIYGVQDRVLLPRLLKLVKGNRLLLPRHLAQAISLTHINNLLKAIHICITQPAAGTSIYNVADAEVYHLKSILLSLLEAVTAQKLDVVNIPKRVWENLIRLCETTRIYPALNSFASASLTQNAVLNIDAIKAIGYHPCYNFENSYEDIGKWIRSTGGYKRYLKSL